MSFKTDYKFGLGKENEILPIIRAFFDRDIIKSTSKFEKFDYSDEKYKYELKSRNNTLEKYPTTIICNDKVITDKLIFLFNFTDGLYYIKYSKSKFDKFEKKLFVRNKRMDFKDLEKEYIFIPIDKLKKIN
jgi:hypothetical protein